MFIEPTDNPFESSSLVMRRNPTTSQTWRQVEDDVKGILSSWLQSHTDKLISISGLVLFQGGDSLNVRLFFNTKPGVGYDAQLADDVSELDLLLTNRYLNPPIDFSCIEMPYFMNGVMTDFRLYIDFELY